MIIVQNQRWHQPGVRGSKKEPREGAQRGPGGRGEERERNSDTEKREGERGSGGRLEREASQRGEVGRQEIN